MTEAALFCCPACQEPVVPHLTRRWSSGVVVYTYVCPNSACTAAQRGIAEVTTALDGMTVLVCAVTALDVAL